MLVTYTTTTTTGYRHRKARTIATTVANRTVAGLWGSGYLGHNRPKVTRYVPNLWRYR